MKATEQTRAGGADEPGCLTAPQVEALKVVYAPIRNPRTGRTIYPGLSVGSEVGWGELPQPFSIAESHLKQVVSGSPDWDFHTTNLGQIDKITAVLQAAAEQDQSRLQVVSEVR
jgi:hypothetical protein